jgi:hypothetical protein
MDRWPRFDTIPLLYEILTKLCRSGVLKSFSSAGLGQAPSRGATPDFSREKAAMTAIATALLHVPYRCFVQAVLQLPASFLLSSRALAIMDRYVSTLVLISGS